MIEIDKISFRFTANDETFANNLYANWDEFCTNCFKKVVDEYLSAYDKEGVVAEINLMELNLGNIPQEQFHQLFPIRLSEELKRCVRLTFMESKERKVSVEHKSESLWLYLKYGVSKAVFENPTFRLDDELSSMICDDKEAIADLLQKAFAHQTPLERMLLQTDQATFANILDIWLSSNSIEINAKKRQLFLLESLYPTLFQQMIEKIAENRILTDQIISLSGIDYSTESKEVQLSHLSKISNGQPNEHQHQPSLNDDEYFMWLTNSDFTLNEQKRYFANIIDKAFSKLQRFILRTEDDQKLLALADAMDEIMVPKIIFGIYGQEMSTEYVLYWTWLYRWLTENYSSIGFTSLGSHQLFQCRLNLALLQTLRINNSELFSKSALTKCFLINLFGKNTEKEMQTLLNYLSARKSESTFEQHNILQNIIIDLQENQQNKVADNIIFGDNCNTHITPTAIAATTLASKPLLGDDIALQTGNIKFYKEKTSDIESDSPNKPDNQFEAGTFTNSTFTQKSTLEEISIFDTSAATNKESETSIIPITPTKNEINSAKQNANKLSETDSIEPLENTIDTPVGTSMAQSEKELLSLITDENIAIEQKVKLLNELSIISSEQFCCLLREIDIDSALFDQLANVTSQGLLLQWFASLSVPKAELLLQVSNLLNIRHQSSQSENIPITAISEEINKALLLLLHERSKSVNEFISEDDEITAESLVQKIYQLKDTNSNNPNTKADHKKAEEQTVRYILQNLSITQSEQYDKEIDIENLIVPNAGLALLTPWFPKLFNMLGLLNNDNNDFKDADSRVRAIFIIQLLVNSEQMEYREQELAFNRVLVGCPFSTPLPKKLELTTEEKDTVDEMLKGVKGNWTKMDGTSIESFQSTFIERSGRLEQGEEQWTLTVESRPYDMLLDSLPWNFRIVRYSWIKQIICVNWR